MSNPIPPHNKSSIPKQSQLAQCPVPPSDQQPVSQVLSEFSEKYYQPMMEEIVIPTNQVIGEKLDQVGIVFRDNQEYVEFCKNCVKTDWESTVYRIKYGKFEASLKVIKTKLHPKQIFTKQLSRGSFGSISILQLNKNVFYALKNIKIKQDCPNSLNLALTQVFISKIMSALQVGPRFSQIFSYDAILYENSVQFAMELCETADLQKLMQKQAKEKKLLISLKLMHKLQICHADIKYENIGWSRSMKKFVFLDFGLSLILNEPIGYKTLTEFRGTYLCCSPEMKKLLLLKTTSYIDMYYNDLYGLNLVWKEMEHRDVVKMENSEIFTEKEEMRFIESQKTKNQALVRYFKAKYSYFHRNFQVLVSLMTEESILLRTFTKMTKIYAQCKHLQAQLTSCMQKLEQRLNSNKKNEPGQKFDHIHQIDNFLYQYQVQNSDKIASNHHLLDKMTEISEAENLFEQFWEDNAWKEQIFFFIDVYSNQAMNFQPSRKKLIQRIFKKLYPDQNEEASRMMKLREVLLYYCRFFEERKNTVVMERIIIYFILMDDDKNRQNIENRILSMLDQQQKYPECYLQNLKYFLGKILIINSTGFFCARKNIMNVQKLTQRLKQSKQHNALVEKYKDTAQIMKKIYRIRKDPESQQSYRRLCEQLVGYLKKVQNQMDSTVKEFINFIIIGENGASILVRPYNKILLKKQIENSYIRAYIFKLQLTSTSNEIERVESLKKILNSQEFTRQFTTMLHYSILSSNVEADVNLKKQLCRDYLNTNSELEESFYSFQFLRSLIVAQSLELAWDMAMDLLQTRFSIRKQNSDDMADLLNFLYNITTCLFTFRHKISREKRQQKSLQMGKIVFPILQYMSLQNVIVDREDEEANDRRFWPKQNFSLFWYVAKVYLLLLQDNHNEAFISLMKLINQIKQLAFKPTEKLDVSLAKLLVKTVIELSGEIFKKKQYGLVITVPLALKRTLEFHTEIGLGGKAFMLIRQLCQFSGLNSFPPFFQQIRNFMDFFKQKKQLNDLIQEQMNHSLRQISSYPKFTYLIGLAFLKIQNQVRNLCSKSIRRLITICVFFLWLFTEGSYRHYKYKLLREAERYFRELKSSKKNRKQTRYEYRKLSLKQTYRAIQHLSSNRKTRLPSEWLHHKFSNICRNVGIEYQY